MNDLLDTNVILRFLTQNKSEKYKNLYSFFESIERGETKVELKLIVLFQVIFVLKSFYSIPKPAIIENIKKLITFKGIKISEKKIVQTMLDLWSKKNTDIVDCYLIASLHKNDRLNLYSYDKGFDRYSINRVEP